MEVVRKLFSFKAAGLFLALLLLFSCGSSARKYLIPKKKFVNFLVDMHIAEAIATDAARRDTEFGFRLDSASLYGSVFKKYGVSPVQFDSTMLYYSRRPEEFQDIYYAVTAQLKNREEKITALRLEEEKTKVITLYEDTREFQFPPLEGYKVPINVPIKGRGTYSVQSKVKMRPQEASMYPRMTVYFYRDNGTPEGARIPFPETRYSLKNGQYLKYTTTMVLDSANYTHIRGYIFNYTNMDTLFPRSAAVTAISVTKKK